MDYVNQAKPLNTKDMPTTGRRDREATYPAGEGADYCGGTHPPAFACPSSEEFSLKNPMKVWGPHGVETRRCVSCDGVLSGAQARYCGERCSDRANKARRRARRALPPPVCLGCGAGLPTRHHKWCVPCRVQRQGVQQFDARKRYLETLKASPVVSAPSWEIPASTVGAIGELAVSADLLRRGYEVFRSVSPAASCDLIVQRGGMMRRVEVRATRRGRDGKLQNRATSRDRGRYDVMALVEPDGSIHYTGLETEVA